MIDETVWGIAREPIAQTFTVRQAVVTVVANHFKSKSGTDPTPADGQGAFNAERVAQAQSLLTFAATLQTGRKNDVCSRRLQRVRPGGPDEGLHRRRLTRPGVRDGTAASTPTRSTASSARSTTSSRPRPPPQSPGRRLGDQLARVGGPRVLRSPPPRRARRSGPATTTRSWSASAARSLPASTSTS